MGLANQEALPGMERREDEEIEQAADRYREIRDERCELSKRESEAKSALIQVMKNKGRMFYSYNGLNVSLEVTDNVKVKARDDDDDEPIGNFRQSRRQQKVEEAMTETVEKLREEDEEIEQQQQTEPDYALQEDGSWKERDRVHKEAVERWQRHRPASAEAEESKEERNYHAEWREDLSVDELLQFQNAPCSCGDIRIMHEGDENDGKCSDPHCGCIGYECADCGTKKGHNADCDHYVLGEGTPVEEAPGELAQINEHGVYVRGLEELKVSFPKKAGKTRVTIHVVKDQSDGMWRSCYAATAASASFTGPIADHDLGHQSRESAVRDAGEKAREFLLRQIDRGGLTDNQKKQVQAAIPALDDWMAINAADHAAVYPDDQIEAKLNSEMAEATRASAVRPPDDFTAPRCDECGRIDGAHTKECSKSHDLRFSDYLAYAEAHYKKNHQSHARKMELTRLNDEKVREWKQQQAAAWKAEGQEIEQELKDNYAIEAGNGAEAEMANEPKKKSRKRGNLSLVEEAIDR